MSQGFNFIQLTPPHATEWAREATAAYDRTLTGQSAVDTLKSSDKPRWYDVRNMHGKVWRRASAPRGRT
jgi:hypothetical protein